MALTILSPTCMLRLFNGQCHIFYQFNVRSVKFYNCMLKCENTIVNFRTKLVQVNYNGSLNCNIMNIKWKYNVNSNKSSKTENTA